jgi:hypothetical protein
LKRTREFSGQSSDVATHSSGSSALNAVLFFLSLSLQYYHYPIAFCIVSESQDLSLSVVKLLFSSLKKKKFHLLFFSILKFSIHSPFSMGIHRPPFLLSFRDFFFFFFGKTIAISTGNEATHTAEEEKKKRAGHP